MKSKVVFLPPAAKFLKKIKDVNLFSLYKEAIDLISESKKPNSIINISKRLWIFHGLFSFGGKIKK